MPTAKHGGKSRKDSDTKAFGYQVHRMFGSHHVVRTLRRDPLSLGRVHDCGMDGRLKAFREYDPLVVCQILKRDLFLVGHRMSYRKNDTQRSSRKCHSGDLGIGWRFRHKGQMEIGRQNAADQFAGELTYKSNLKPGTSGQIHSQNC